MLQFPHLSKLATMARLERVIYNVFRVLRQHIRYMSRFTSLHSRQVHAATVSRKAGGGARACECVGASVRN